MKRIIALTVLLSAGFVGGSYAADPIAARQALMKNNGAAAGVGVKMMKGEMDFDPAAAQLIFRTWNSAANAIVFLVPPGSETGMDTKASPKIWEDMAGFEAVAAKLAADTGNVEITDLDSFKAAFGAVAQNCNDCHETYRIKTN
jgi:cytochrome c556